MGISQQRKGYRIEREIVERHRSAGIPANRVILSGAAGALLPGPLGAPYRGDVKVFPGEMGELTGEVKARKNGSGFTQLEKWLRDNDLLFLRRDCRQPGDRTALIVAMPWDVYERLLTGMEGERRRTDSEFSQGVARAREGNGRGPSSRRPVRGVARAREGNGGSQGSRPKKGRVR